MNCALREDAMAEQTFTILDIFDDTGRRGMRVDFDAPLPLGYCSAVKRAAQMRNGNPSVFTYPTIAEIMAVYHGLRRSPAWWRRELVGEGLVPKDRRGTQENLKPGGRRLRVVA
jgi:hypothetical protein